MSTRVTVLLAAAVVVTACEAGERVVLSTPGVHDTAVEDTATPDAYTTDVADVGPPESCGDGVCVLAIESATTCPADCVVNCGDGICTDVDGFSNCPVDCTESADVYRLPVGESCVDIPLGGVEYYEIRVNAFDVEVYTMSIPYPFQLDVLDATGRQLAAGTSTVSAETVEVPVYLRVQWETDEDGWPTSVASYCIHLTER